MKKTNDPTFKQIVAQYDNALSMLTNARNTFIQMGSIEGSISHKNFVNAQQRVKDYAMKILTHGKQHWILAVTYLFTWKDNPERQPETYVDEFIDTDEQTAQSIVEFAAIINNADLTILDIKKTQPQRHAVKL